jgi:hypothetical protein
LYLPLDRVLAINVRSSTLVRFVMSRNLKHLSDDASAAGPAANSAVAATPSAAKPVNASD